MKAFIIAGGEGTRLRPLTYRMPKSMLPVGSKPMVQYVLEHLKANGVTEVLMAVGYLHEKISAHFSDGKKLGMKISYSVEKEPLGTAGSIMASRERPEEPFFVLMGDAIMDIDLGALAKAHARSGALATVALLKHKTKIPYGVAKVDDGFIIDFQEKPELEHYINIGVYVLSPGIFDFIRAKDDFARDVFPRLLSKGERIAAFKVEKGVWIDIGRLEEYEKLKDGREIAKMLKKA